jgi:hypothetical protein
VQGINAEEREAADREKAEVKAGKTAYQYGGEPVGPQAEVLIEDMLCFHHPKVVEFFQAQIRDILAVEGVVGIALDFFGYRNYRCCRCERSLALLADFRGAHPGTPEAQAQDQFSMDTLVAVCNDLADFARRVKPGTQVTGHVYPVFLPEVLYGNRLNWDTCCQTAAWFFEPFWTEDKIRSYSRVIVGEANKHWPHAEGAALIGVYVKPAKYPVKGPARLDMELRTMLQAGVQRVHVCSLNDVLDDADAREVFRRYRTAK